MSGGQRFAFVKVMALVTEDFRFFHAMVRLLKEKGEPFISLGLDDVVPPNVKVVITTSKEASLINFPSIIASDDPDLAYLRAKSWPLGRRERAIVGIDPGRAIGLAYIEDGKLTGTDLVFSPEGAHRSIKRMLADIPMDSITVRIGHGDATNRDRIIRAIWNIAGRIEIVDETATSGWQEPHCEAACAIAKQEGEVVAKLPQVRPSVGELRDLQRLSRIESGGLVTISLPLARMVARGEMTLHQAVVAQQRKN
jgi:hypothetical protein